MVSILKESSDAYSVMFNCVFVTFPCGILSQMLYLIVSIPNLATFLTSNHCCDDDLNLCCLL